MAARKKKDERDVALGPRSIGPLGMNSFYAKRYGAALDLNVISRAISYADTGYPASLHDILNELRQKVAPLHSVLQTRELALLGKGWSIRAYKAEGTEDASEQDEKVAAHVRWALKSTRKFKRSLAHLLDANVKGFSVCETEWEMRQGHVVPRELHCIAGRRWKFENDERLVFWDDGLCNPARDLLTEMPHRFVCHQPRVNGDTAAREGLGRVLVWLAAFANKGWRDMIMLSEMYGRPERVVTIVKEHADDKDRQAAEEVADAGLTTGSTLITDAVKVETRWPEAKGTSASTPAKPVLDQAKDEMALAVLGQLGTTSDVKGGLGATGGNQEKVRGDILNADNDAISETITDQLIRWIVLFEFGPDTPLPEFSFDIEETADAKTLAEALEILVGLGLEVPKRFVHDATGIPAPSDDEPILSKPAAPTPSPNDPGKPPSKGQEDDGEEPPGSGKGDGQEAA